MKRLKKILALAIAMAMVVAMALPTFAGTLTIKNELAGYTYDAYQLFTGDYSDGKLSNVKWGTAIAASNRAAFLTALQSEGVISEAIAYDSANADASAAALAKALDKTAEAKAKALADVADQYATTSIATVNSQTEVGSKSYYKFTGLADGYYLIKNSAKTGTSDDQKTTTFSEFIVQVVGDAEAEAKTGTVTVDKKVDTDTTDVKITDADKAVNSAAIGDTFAYIIEGTLPENFAQYEHYYYKFSDEMVGIDYVTGDVTTTTDKTEAAAQVLVVDASGNQKAVITSSATITYTNQTAATGTGAKTTFAVEIDDLKAVTLGDGVSLLPTDKIVVKYWGQLNNFANVGTTANTNDVDLTFTNNPEKSGNGTSTPGGNPEYKDATGTTPKAHTDTYDSGIEITKIGDSDESNKLAGAKFQITGNDLYTVKQENGYKFVEVPYTLQTGSKNSDEAFEQDGGNNVVYYALKDNADPTNELKYTYTTTAKDTETMDQALQNRYVDGKTYNKVTYTKTVTEKAANVTYTGYTDSNGKLVFEGLKPGTYTLKELVAPAGYNLADDIQITISFDETNKTFTTTYTPSTVTNGIIGITVDDLGGQTLPSTGGIGTTIFYVVGAILVIGAGVVLITKRRMEA